MGLSEDDHASQPPMLDWQNGVPISRQFNDPYYSLADGWAETEHVFIAGNGLPERFKPGFHIAELGFGTGLNVLVALAAWRKLETSGPLRFTSFEAHPLPLESVTEALAQIPGAEELRGDFLKYLAGDRTALLDLDLTLVEGDARQKVPAWNDQADAWFLDGFSPAKNPELWEPELLAAVSRATARDGTAATYTAAGHVRRALDAAGFAVERVPGYGRKRHMTKAVRR